MATDNQKPASISACNKAKWQMGQIVSFDSGMVDLSVAEAKSFIDDTDIALSRMLSGDLPDGVGANTAMASFMFKALAQSNLPPERNGVVGTRAGVSYFAKPYKSSLHEIRIQNAKSKAKKIK